jgi:prophage antirepressor-like protein
MFFNKKEKEIKIEKVIRFANNINGEPYFLAEDVIEFIDQYRENIIMQDAKKGKHAIEVLTQLKKYMQNLKDSCKNTDVPE